MNETTVFLAQVLGLYFLIVGALVIVRQSSMLKVFSNLTKSPVALYCIAFVELGAGIALAVAYPTVGWDIAGIIAIVGYMMIVESLFYLGVPLGVTKKIIHKFSNQTWYATGGIIAIALGAYLAGVGFGYFAPFM